MPFLGDTPTGKQKKMTIRKVRRTLLLLLLMLLLLFTKDATRINGWGWGGGEGCSDDEATLGGNNQPNWPH